MKKIILTIALVLIFAVNGYCGGVTDNNNGTEGDILVSTGRNNGQRSEGTWTDSSFLKGDTGEQGEKGDRGRRGKRGKRGKAGQDGVDGADGQDGVNGESGQDGTDGESGQDGVTGKKGDRGIKGRDVDPTTLNEMQETINKLEEPKYYFVPQVRLIDTKKWEVKPYSKFDIEDSFRFSEAGVKVTFKFGKSYEEKRLDELEKRIEAITKQADINSLTVVPYNTTGLKIKTNF